MDSFEVPTIAEELWQPGSATDDENEATLLPCQDKFLTGSKAIDEAFQGGLDYGKVHCITARAEHGARELSRALLATHLLRSSEATATIIDSTLTFDVRRLHATLRSSLPSGGQSDAMDALKRLKISKVFDRMGMMEAVAELGEVLNAEKQQQEQQRPAGMTTPRKSTIEDSEDEDDILDESPVKRTSRPASTPAPSITPKRLVIVDSISHVMTPIIKNDYTQGQALLTSLLRLVKDVTQQHNLCTIVLGEAGFKLVPEDETLSRFKSCRIKPAVGYGLGYLVDVHSYLHHLPSRTVSENVQAGQQPIIHVLEIVEERDGNRQWSWAAFRFTEEGGLEDVKA